MKGAAANKWTMLAEQANRANRDAAKWHRQAQLCLGEAERARGDYQRLQIEYREVGLRRGRPLWASDLLFDQFPVVKQCVDAEKTNTRRATSYHHAALASYTKAEVALRMMAELARAQLREWDSPRPRR